ncbi:uncharacterized protein LOC131150369 isoform X2 [Malania oleifera]|uniref:uncharacterized protein LOC131150369 isoform X2 n=1 Tax=Malania oleifera TaxID=397392 RepID=UPI0025AEAA61|nr:uncharacterized protein LOC131150369 isoform X2 [Malania oleifera]
MVSFLSTLEELDGNLWAWQRLHAQMELATDPSPMPPTWRIFHADPTRYVRSYSIVVQYTRRSSHPKLRRERAQSSTGKTNVAFQMFEKMPKSLHC